MQYESYNYNNFIIFFAKYFSRFINQILDLKSNII